MQIIKADLYRWMIGIHRCLLKSVFRFTALASGDFRFRRFRRRLRRATVGRELTLEEIGKRFNVSRERIRQIEKKALNRLRHSSRREKLKYFID